jgi:short-subunit dehydrogenase|tara:strand:- start:373 stop:1032 length:660 start_codon:yes stop_codon:yes gene_type:complete
MKRIAITGCSSGLGEALVNEAEYQGHKVFPHYRRGIPCTDSKKLIGEISDWDFADRFNSFLQVNNIDTFINNAGMYYGGPLQDMSDASIVRMIDVNVTSQILIMKRVYKRFKSMKKGLIININSLAYQQPSGNETIYCATKFALKGFSKALQMEAIGTGVEIIDVHPGGIQTRMTEDRPGFDTMMSREDVAGQVINLIKRDSNYMNEVVLRKRNESRSS